MDKLDVLIKYGLLPNENVNANAIIRL